MTDFGDIELDDIYADEGEPDPLQVAIRLHELRSAMLVLAGYEPLPPWHVYLKAHLEEQAAEHYTITVDGLRDLPWKLAELIHEIRRSAVDPGLPAWEELPPDARELAVHLVKLVVAWLVREGALR